MTRPSCNIPGNSNIQVLDCHHAVQGQDCHTPSLPSICIHTWAQQVRIAILLHCHPFVYILGHNLTQLLITSKLIAIVICCPIFVGHHRYQYQDTPVGTNLLRLIDSFHCGVHPNLVILVFTPTINHHGDGFNFQQRRSTGVVLARTTCSTFLQGFIKPNN